jgi:UDP-glucose 4-epimerase
MPGRSPTGVPSFRRVLLDNAHFTSGLAAEVEHQLFVRQPSDPTALRGERVLVTGAGGFVGGRVCRRLATAGADVVGTSRSEPADLPDIEWIPGDLRDSDTASAVAREARPDVVVHLAGHVEGSPETGLLAPTLETNVLGTINLLQAALEAGARRVIVTGTMMEPDFGAARGVPNSPYAASKWASSAYARMFHAIYDLPVVILRLFMVYGPGQSEARKLIPFIIQSLLRGEEPELSSGRWEVDWVYIDDVVDAFLCAAVAGDIHGQTIDVGTGRLESVARVAQRLAAMIGGEVGVRLGARPDRPGELARTADVRRTEELIGWTPRVSLRDGLERTVDWHTRQLRHTAV